MRTRDAWTLVATLAMAAVPARVSQGQASDPDRLVKNGGVLVKGWTGRVDPQAEKGGARLTDARFSDLAGGWLVVAGPPAIYWNPANAAAGDYTASARFNQETPTEHAEYYGLFIGGSQLDRPRQNYLYCAIAGNGTFTVKHRLGDEVHELAGRTAHSAIRKVGPSGKASNEVAWRVTGARTSCLVNGTEVWGYGSASLVGEGKLESLNGIVGLRVNHNLDVHVTGFAIKRP
ncbi:MAG: hypothetical protein IT361_01490 [Gemmatimonadaceae bacterium]|nr:hypothetical protein [Gemmatimonadaceae bacterium]